MTPLSILLVVVSALLHSSWNFTVKRGNWPPALFFWVFFFGGLLYLPIFFALGVFPAFILHAPLKLWEIVILSGLFETIYFVCLVEAYRIEDLSLVYPISRSAPLFTQIWAFLLIGEVVSTQGTAGIGLVILGLFVISLQDFKWTHFISLSRQMTSRPYLLALTAAIGSSIYSVIDKVGVQTIHPFYYIWFVNLWMTVFTGLYLFLLRRVSFLPVLQRAKKEILLIAVLQNAAYLLVLMAMTMSKVSYVVAFRQVGALFGAGMGIILLKESHWKTRMTGTLVLTLGLALIALAK